MWRDSGYRSAVEPVRLELMHEGIACLDVQARVECLGSLPGRRHRGDRARPGGIRGAAAAGEAVFPEFDVEVRDAAGALVARVHKQIYVRRK
jgi:hypothetical protein